MASKLLAGLTVAALLLDPSLSRGQSRPAAASQPTRATTTRATTTRATTTRATTTRATTTRPAVAPAVSSEPPEENKPRLEGGPTIWQRAKLSTKWYLSYAFGEQGEELFNRFGVGRGYVTLKLEPTSWLEPRVTFDAHQVENGDFVVRLKYLHAKLKAPIETAVISEPNVELGLVHTPWFDFEEQINSYRMEGTMFIERNKSMNSADLGVTVGGLLGRKLPEDYRRRVSGKYPGTWGSFALGVYNGGGYHAAENNDNKVFQSRLTLRPLGPLLPNLQLSHFLVYGRGNTAEVPDWRLNDLMLSFEHEYFVVTGQLALGEGNQKGDKVDDDGNALDFFGYSFFAELKLPWIHSTLIGRFDRFDWDRDGGEPASTRIIAGYALHFLPHNFVLLSLDRVTYGAPGQPADTQGKITLQIAYPY